MDRPRVAYIDNLRVLLISLVILLHTSVTYGGEGSWYYYEVDEPGMLSFVVLTLFNAANQAFFMGMLFLLAGYFTPGSFDRKGPRRFLLDRLVRLGIPMLCYDFAISPLLVCVLWRAGQVQLAGSFGAWLGRYYSSFHLGTGPLWFVETLLIFSVVYALWWVVAGRRPARPAQDTGSAPSNAAIISLAVVMGMGSFLVRIWLPIGWAFGPLNLQLPFFVQYIFMFPLGVIAFRRNWLERIPTARGMLWLGVAAGLILVGAPALLALGGALEGDVSQFKGGFHWQAFAYALLEQLLCVAMITGLIVLFRERFGGRNKLTGSAAAASYAAYVIHAPVLVLLSLALRGVTIYPLVKFAVVGSVAVVLCFLLGHALRQLPLARRVF